MIIKKVHRILTPNLIQLDSGDRVRLISVDDSKQVDTDDDSSLDFLTSLIAGKYVRVEFDKKMTDPDGNLLAYLYIKTSFTGEAVWAMVNKRVIATGYAGFRPDRVNDSNKLVLESLESVAKDKKSGIWKE